jgi:hypothetical protein
VPGTQQLPRGSGSRLWASSHTFFWLVDQYATIPAECKSRDAAAIRALLHDTGARYRASYDELRAAAPADRIARFEAVIDFHLKDIATWETRRYFIHHARCTRGLMTT